MPRRTFFLRFFFLFFSFSFIRAFEWCWARTNYGRDRKRFSFLTQHIHPPHMSQAKKSKREWEAKGLIYHLFYRPASPPEVTTKCTALFLFFFALLLRSLPFFSPTCSCKQQTPPRRACIFCIGEASKDIQRACFLSLFLCFLFIFSVHQITSFPFLPFHTFPAKAHTPRILYCHTNRVLV